MCQHWGNFLVFLYFIEKWLGLYSIMIEVKFKERKCFFFRICHLYFVILSWSNIRSVVVLSAVIYMHMLIKKLYLLFKGWHFYMDYSWNAKVAKLFQNLVSIRCYHFIWRNASQRANWCFGIFFSFFFGFWLSSVVGGPLEIFIFSYLKSWYFLPPFYKKTECLINR